MPWGPYLFDQMGLTIDDDADNDDEDDEYQASCLTQRTFQLPIFWGSVNKEPCPCLDGELNMGYPLSIVSTLAATQHE